MRAAFPYLGRGSWLARRDPRVPLIAAATFVIGVVQLRDPRHLAIVLVLALGYYLTAQIPWRAIRAQWAYLLVVVFIFSLFNMLISGGRTGSFADADTHVLVTLPPFGTEITAEGISLMVSQILRFACIAAVSFPVAFAIAPGDLGVALRRLGLGDRIAVMVDLTIRFIPTIASEFAETIDAQRVRGYDPMARSGRAVQPSPSDGADLRAGDRRLDCRCGGHHRRDGPARVRRRQTHMASPAPFRRHRLAHRGRLPDA